MTRSPTAGSLPTAGSPPTARPLPAARPLDAIAGFAAMLREHGLTVGIAEQQAMVGAALCIPVDRPAQLQQGWRAIVCHDARAWKRWPELFERHWHPERARGSTRLSGETRERRSLQQVVQDLQRELGARTAPATPPADTALQPPAVADGIETAPAPRAQQGASRADALHDRSLSQWLPQDLAELERLAERIAALLRRRLTRRWRRDAHGRRLDLRRTLRASLHSGGVPIDPAWRSRRRERPRLFMLVDVSRSMQTHAQLFLRIARAFVAAAQARVFVFHTRLAEVTPLLRRDSAAIQEKINAVTAGFGGGTRIATSIADFRTRHARAHLSRRARVWILSDGFDADEAHRLAEELGQVRGRGARITWFHPSARPPASAAMRAVAAQRGLLERRIRLNSLSDLATAAGLLGRPDPEELR